MKRSCVIILCTAILLAVLAAAGCGQVTDPSAESTKEAAAPDTFPYESETEENITETAGYAETAGATAADTLPQEAGELTIWKPGDRRCNFSVVYDAKAEEPLTAEAEMFAAMIKNYTGAQTRTSDSSKSADKEIVLSSVKRAETKEMLEGLSEGEYAVRVLPGEKEGDGKLLVATTTYGSAYACAEFLLETYFTEQNGFCVPLDLNVTGTEKDHYLIESNINKLRDPCVLVEDGVYYAYGTGWKCYKNVKGDLSKAWKKLDIEMTLAHPETDGGSHWAPEVHKYNGAYYMFTTYYNSVTKHRGCIILKSDSPEGPFVEITDGHVTPAGWDAIDGTFYVDPDGQPWMVFVHEWTSMPDGVGSFAAAKLSADLTHFISEPTELFKANEPVWAAANVTDGCFMYTTAEGELLLIWSNFDSFGYAVAVARSSNGRLDGEWIHEKNLLYSKYMTNGYDGGHAMVFTGTDGQTYIAFHSPNTATDDRKEKPVFLAIEEKDGKLVPAENAKKSAQDAEK